MSWGSVGFDWNGARAVLVTAEEGSLTAAAGALGVSQPTLGRQVAAFEASLGVTLFQREGRRLVPTETGLLIAGHARAMADAANALSLSATGQADSVAGTVTVSATEVMATFVLPALLAELRRTTPELSVEVVAANEAADLTRREADIAIRGFRPRQSELIARRLRDVEAAFYGAHSLLDAGVPQPEDAVFVGFEHSDALVSLLRERGVSARAAQFQVRCDNRIVQWEMVKQGAGIGIMPVAIGDAEPSVRRVFTSLGPVFAELWLVTHRELRTSARIRLVFDTLATALSGDELSSGFSRAARARASQ